MAGGSSGATTFRYSIGSAIDFNAALARIDVGGEDAGINNNYIFELTRSFTLDRQLYAINLQGGSAGGNTLSINASDGAGSVYSINGGGTYRGLFVYAGTVTVNDLAFTNVVARGGTGSSGGAGLGGGLFIASSGDVTVKNVSFAGTSAVGGSASFDYVGGGGLGGDASIKFVPGASNGAVNGGGGGIGANGGYGGGGNAGTGIVLGAAGGGAGGANANGPGGTGGVNGGGGGGGRAGSGGGGGIGGTAGANSPNTAARAGDGGFGGGGGGASSGGSGGISTGGNGGFGGGGGSANASSPTSISGDGGFGGGGGGIGNNSTVAVLTSAGVGGFGGGNAARTGGGGGLGAGADVFVQEGGSLKIAGSSNLAGGTVGGGSGYRDGSAGAALGSGIFIQGNQSFTIAPGIGNTTTIAGTIADQTGSQAELLVGQGYSPGTGSLTIGAGLTVLTGANTFTGVTTISGGILNIRNIKALGSTGAGTTVTVGATLQIQGGISIAEALTLSGNGTIGVNGALQSVSGANAVTGTVTLAADSRITADAGTLTLSAFNAVTGDFGMTLGGSGNGLIAGTIATGTSGVTKDGDGTWTLSGANSYSGSTTILGGTLQIGNGGTSGSITGDISNFGALILNRSDGTAGAPVTYSGSISGSGSLTKAGSSVLRLDGSNSYSGATAINAGTLLVQGGNAIGDTSAVNITAGATLSLSSNETIGSLSGDGIVQMGRVDLTVGGNDASTTYAGLLNGTGGRLEKIGTGTLILTGMNAGPESYGYDSVGTIVSGGTLQIGDGRTSGAIRGNVLNSATLVFDRSDDVAFGSSNSSISGTGELIKRGAGTLTIAGTNDYTGLTKIEAGTLSIAGTLASAVAVAMGATLGGTGMISGAVDVESGGRIAAGNSPGLLSIGNLSLAAGSTLAQEITGRLSGTGYDQIRVNGTVSLDGATLDLAFDSFVSGAGDSFVLIDNDGSSDAVTGAGGRAPSLVYGGRSLSEGAAFLANGRTYRISYAGGDGNDVTLTDVTPAAPQPDPQPILPIPTASDDSLTGTAGPDTISLGLGNDTYTGGRGADLVYGNPGNDLIYGNQDADTLYGGQGDDRAYGGQGDDSLYGNQGNDMLFGNAGADIVYGNQGNDIVYGNQGADSLFGGQGNDMLYGGQDADTLVGGIGDDTLVGGLGSDLYRFDPNSGRDLILGFNQAEGDRLALGGQTYTVSSAQNGDALLTLSGGGTVDLAGIRADQVSASYFAA